MKLYFFYVPLLFVGYALVDSEKELRRFGNVNLVLIVIIVSLGVAQSLLGHAFLNPENLGEDIRSSAELTRTAPISHVSIYRANGIFVSHGRYADFLMVAWSLVLGFSGYFLLRSRRGSTIAFVALMITSAGALLSGSRGVFVWTIIGAVLMGTAFFWGAPWSQGEFRRIIRLGQRIILGTALAIVFLMSAYPEALLGRLAVYSETLSPYSASSELSHRTIDYPMQNFGAAFTIDRWAYGYGIGTASLGAQYVARIFHQRPLGIGVESGFGSLIIELGIGGLILWLILGMHITISGWRVVKRLKGSPLFPLAFAILWSTFVEFFLRMYGGVQGFQDFILGSYLWLLLGILFRLPTIRFPNKENPAQASRFSARRF